MITMFIIGVDKGWCSFNPGVEAGLLAELPYGLFLEDAQNGAYFWISIRSKNTFLCLAGCRYKEASSNVRGGRPQYIPTT